jgi:tetratricopeptide (TPR) repeat protein
MPARFGQSMALHELFSNRHDDAIGRLHRAIALDPNSSFARGNLGVAYSFGGESDRSLAALEEAMRLSPRDFPMVIWHTASAWSHLHAERFVEAANCAKQAIEFNPDFPDSHGTLAASAAYLGHTADARAGLRWPRQRRISDTRRMRALGSMALCVCQPEGIVSGLVAKHDRRRLAAHLRPLIAGCHELCHQPFRVPASDRIQARLRSIGKLECQEPAVLAQLQRTVEDSLGWRTSDCMIHLYGAPGQRHFQRAPRSWSRQACDGRDLVKNATKPTKVVSSNDNL